MTKFKIALIVTLSLSIMSFIGAQSGINSFGNTYVHSNSKIGLHGNLVFNNNGAGAYPGLIITNRNSTNPGAVAFGKTAAWENAGDHQHVDGYVQVFSDNAFTFPIGNLGYYKPVSISGGSGTMAAYTFDNPFKLPFIGESLNTRASSSNVDSQELTVSEVEYWDIRGESATAVTLYWDTNSDIEQLANDDLTTLTIVGWKGSSWEIISSSVDENVIDITRSTAESNNSESTVYSGSITSEVIVPDDYDVFTFAAISSSSNDGNVTFGSKLNDENIELTVFPNPTSDLSEVNIDYDITDISSDAFLVVYNSIGENIYKKALVEDKAIFQLPHSENVSGTYQIGIVTENGSMIYKTVVISK